MKKTSAQQSTVVTLLRSRGLRATAARMRVLAALMQTPEPVAVDVLAARFPNINMVTLYRMLDRFAREGLVYRSYFRNGKAFFEYQPTHHHHLTCIECGLQEPIEVCPSEAHRRVGAASHKFATVESHMLEFFGVCKACA